MAAITRGGRRSLDPGDEKPRAFLRERRLLKNGFLVFFLLLLAIGFSACGVRDADNVAVTGTNANDHIAILLFTGTGTSPGDVEAIKVILNNNHLGFSTVTSSQLNTMGKAELVKYSLLIVPGGNFEKIGNGLTPD